MNLPDKILEKRLAFYPLWTLPIHGLIRSFRSITSLFRRAFFLLNILDSIFLESGIPIASTPRNSGKNRDWAVLNYRPRDSRAPQDAVFDTSWENLCLAGRFDFKKTTFTVFSQ
ncbi:hypothetical protein MAP00_003828 [Monascus purpureus]|nr:hypothetical protein MAP00_003828 [Monascus purpureus]